MTDPLVLAETHPNGVALLRLNRPPLNPLSHDMLTALTAEANTIAADLAVKAVVVTGSDRAFAAGADIDEFGTSEDAGNVSRDFRAACAALRGGRSRYPPHAQPGRCRPTSDPGLRRQARGRRRAGS